MSEESTSRDLVELIRRQVAAADSGDIDAMTSFFASDAVWDSSPMGLEVYEGQEAIRRFFKEWWGAYDESAFEAEEILDLGNGVTFCVFRPRGRLIHSSGEVGLRYAAVGVWVESLIVRVTNYTDTDQARAAAERLAESRG